MGRQLGLNLMRPPVFDRESFVVSESNAEAVTALDAWPGGSGGALALVGPEGSGKTHLASDWAERNGAVYLADVAAEVADLPALEGRAVVVDDAHQVSDETLFHLINLAAAPGGSLLLVSRARPQTWAADLPDLRSRLNALRVVELGEPDDAVLRAVLTRWFERRAIRPAEDLLDYLVRRIERSAARAREVVAALDEAAAAENRPVTRALARRVLESEPATGELFD